MWWHGASRPQGLTADADSGAGLQARKEGEDQPPNGDAIPAPLADGDTESDPDPRDSKLIPENSEGRPSNLYLKVILVPAGAQIVHLYLKGMAFWETLYSRYNIIKYA